MQKVNSELLDTLQKNLTAKLFNSEETPWLNEDFEAAYHYTSLEALVSILDKEEFRFTSVRYLNDPSELDEGIKVLRDVFSDMLPELIKRFPNIAFVLFWTVVSVHCALLNPEDKASALEFWKTHNPPQLPNIKELHNIDIYVASFSYFSDSLGQWLAYGDGGKGVAIGFSLTDPDIFGERNAPFIQNSEKLFNGKHVNYTAVNYASFDKKYAFGKAFIDALIFTLSNEGLQDIEVNQTVYSEMWNKLSGHLLQNIVSCKNTSYKEEKEFRCVDFVFVSNETPRQEFLVSKGLIKPYRNFSIDKSCIKSITLGPLSRNPLNLKAIKSLTKSRGLINCQAYESSITFRG